MLPLKGLVKPDHMVGSVSHDIPINHKPVASYNPSIAKNCGNLFIYGMDLPGVTVHSSSFFYPLHFPMKSHCTTKVFTISRWYSHSDPTYLHGTYGQFHRGVLLRYPNGCNNSQLWVLYPFLFSQAICVQIGPHLRSSLNSLSLIDYFTLGWRSIPWSLLSAIVVIYKVYKYISIYIIYLITMVQYSSAVWRMPSTHHQQPMVCGSF